MISLIIILLIIFSLTCIVYIIYLKYFKKYTRERYAFTATLILSGLISSFLLQIYSSEGCVSAAINTSHFLFNTEFSTYKADFKDHVISFCALILIYRFIINLYKNWNGPISELHYNNKILHINSSLLNDTILQIKDFFRDEKIIIPYTENKKIDKYRIFNTTENDDKMAWHENVYELLTFSDSQYKIDLYNDYYQENRCFISKYGTENYIAILCSLETPTEQELNNFIEFIEKQNYKYLKVITAIKNSNQSLSTQRFRNYEITVRNENEMLDSLIDFSSYKLYIQNLFSKNEITQGTNITLNDIYVGLDGKNYENNPIGEVESYIKNWLSDYSQNKHLAILGEYGCGKSVLSLKVAYELFLNSSIKRIPILIELRGKSPRNLNIVEILSTWGANFRIEATSLFKLHKAGRLLLIFEGFDEMDMIGDREIRLNHFQRLWEFAIPNSKIIITGRPNFFLDDRELKINLGIDKPYDSSHFCEAIYLEKFKKDQIKLALRNVDNNTRNQVLDILEKQTNSNFYDLISRPAILFLVSVIWRERKLSEIKDKINSALVISEFIKHSYSRQENKKINFPLSEKEREYFMLGISAGMLQKTEFSNQINKTELENFILKLYKNFPDEISSFDNAIQPHRKPLKARMIDNHKAEDTVLTDVRSCGILVNDLTRKDYFKFAHKSFLEYQISLLFVESILQDKGNYNMQANSISKALDINFSNFQHSPETIAFTTEILISKLNLSTNDDPRKICRNLFTILYPKNWLGKHPHLAAFIDCHFSFILHITRSHFIGQIVLGFSEKELTKLGAPNKFKRAIIWLNCCQQLNIDSEIMYSVTSKEYINLLTFSKNNNTELFKNDPIIRFLKRITRNRISKNENSSIEEFANNNSTQNFEKQTQNSDLN